MSTRALEEADASATRSGRRSARAMRHQSFAVVVVTALSAVGAAFASGEGTNHGPVDLVLRVAIAASVTLAATRARPWALALASALGVVCSVDDTAIFVFALLVFAAAVSNTVADRSEPLLGALIGGGAVQVLLRLPSFHPTNLTAVAAAAGFGAIVLSGYRNSDVGEQRTARRVGIVVAIALGAALLLFTAELLLAQGRLRHGIDAARAGIDAARLGQTAKALRLFDTARDDLASARDQLNSPLSYPTRIVPVVAQNERALRTLVDNAETLVATGSRSAHDADIESLKIRDGRLDPARIATMRGPLEDVEAALRQSRAHLNGIDRQWLVPPMHDAVTDLTGDLQRAQVSTVTAEIGVDAAPRLLGADQPRNYFLAFTTPSESRAGGGFMGNWGILTVTDGRFELSAFGRTDELNAAGDASTKQITGQRDYLSRYGGFSPATEWRNVNMSPDFPTVARVIKELYPQSGGGAIDGVIAIDPEGLAALLKLTGPVVVPGRDKPLTTKNAAQFLLRDQYLEFGSTARVDFLSDAAHAVTDRLTHSNLPGPRTIGQVLAQAARGGHLQVHSFDPQGERLFRRLGTEQTLDAAGGDFVGLVTQNASGSKLELFLHRSLHVSSTVDPSSGTIHSTVTIQLRNDAPTSGLPDYVIGNALELPTGTTRLYVSFYSSLGTTGAILDGAPVPMETQTERGLKVSSTYVTVAPGSTATLELQLAGDAPFRRTSGGTAYQVRVLHQAMVNPDNVIIDARLTSPWSFGGSARGFTIHDGQARFRTALEGGQTLAFTIADSALRSSK